jgi:hypothetical protein
VLISAELKHKSHLPLGITHSLFSSPSSSLLESPVSWFHDLLGLVETLVLRTAPYGCGINQCEVVRSESEEQNKVNWHTPNFNELALS